MVTLANNNKVAKVRGTKSVYPDKYYDRNKLYKGLFCAVGT